MSDDLHNADTPESPAAPTARPTLGVLQRTAAAISPWVRQWWTGGASEPARATTARATTGGRVPGQSPLALRIQRSVAFADHAAGGGALTNRFTHSIVQRHTAAEQIGRRYRPETRQATTTPPAQMPLPGVQSGNRAQRAPGEMSLDELARSYQAERAESPAAGDMPVQREFDPAAEQTGSAQTTLIDIQDAMRRANQARAGQTPATPGAPSGTPAVQRTPASNSSVFSSIDERVRQARERLSAAGQAPVEVPAPGQVPPRARPTVPQPSPSAPPTSDTPGADAPSVQRSPTATDPSTEAGNSIAAAIRDRIRAARERMASEPGTPPSPSASTPPSFSPPPQAAAPTQAAPTPPVPTPPSVQRTPASPARPAPPTRRGAPPAAQTPPPPIQRTPTDQEMVGVPKDAPRELPVPPTTDAASEGFSKAEAVRQRIQRVREQGGVTPPAENLVDPDSPDFSRAEGIRQRIEQASVQRQPLRASPDPQDPNFSVTAQIRERIAASRAQREAEIEADAASADDMPAQESTTESPTEATPPRTSQTSAPATSESSPPPIQRAPEPPVRDPAPQPEAAPPTIDPSRSIADQIRNRIQAARERLQGGQPPAASQPATPPPSTPEAAAPDMPATGPTAPTTSPASAPNVQRTPDDRPAIARELHLKPSGLSGKELPQTKRVRALTRSQIITPERKTGDFTAGEAPRPGAAQMLPPRVQRTPDEAAPSTPAPPNTPAAETPPASSEDSDDSSGGQVQRSIEEGPPPAHTPPAASASVAPPTPSSSPDAPPAVQRSAASTTPERAEADSSTGDNAAPDAPVTSAAEAVQRTPDNRAIDRPEIRPETPNVDETPAPNVASPDVQRAVERTPTEHASTEPAPPPPALSTPSAPPATRPTVQRAAAPTAPDVPASAASEPVQRAPDSPNTRPPDVRDAAPLPATAAPDAPAQVQRTPDIDAGRDAAGANAPRSSEPSKVDAGGRAGPATEQIQRAPETRTADTHTAPDAPGDTQSAATPSTPPVSPPAATSPTVQRSSAPPRADTPPVETPALESPAAQAPASEAPMASASERVQRTPGIQRTRDAASAQADRTEPPASAPTATSRPVEPALPAASAPESVQRTPAADPLAPRAADSRAGDASAPVQRTPAPGIAQENTAANANVAPPGQQAPRADAGLDVSVTSDSQAVQRSREAPAAATRPVNEPPAPDESPTRAATPAASAPTAPTAAPSADVQRAPATQVEGDPSVTEPSVTRAPDLPAAYSPASEAAPSVQRAPSQAAESQSAPQPSVAETLVAPESVQRMPDGQTVSDAPAQPREAPPAQTSPAVQRTVEPVTPDAPVSERGASDEHAPDTSAAPATDRVQRAPSESAPPKSPPPFSGKLPPEARAVQRAAAESNKPSVVAAIEERMRLAREGQSDASATSAPPTSDLPDAPAIQRAADALAPSAPESVQRTPAPEPSPAPPSPSRPSTPSLTRASKVSFSAKLPPEAIAIQRVAATSKKPSIVAALDERMRLAKEGQSVSGLTPLPAPTPWSSDSSSVGLPSIQRTPDSAAPDGDFASFLPINRYRDPRMLARKVEKGPSSLLADLPLSRAEPSTVLPQTRTNPGLPLVESRLQRERAEGATSLFDLPRIGSPVRAKVQRKAQRAQSSIKSSATTPKVQRATLPLAKLRVATNGLTIQRDPTTDLDDSFVGSTSTASSRGKTQTENLGGVDLKTRMAALKQKAEEEDDDDESCECSDESGGKKEQDLDRLARAILPVVKRMLAIERDRRDPRLLL